LKTLTRLLINTDSITSSEARNLLYLPHLSPPALIDYFSIARNHHPLHLFSNAVSSLISRTHDKPYTSYHTHSAMQKTQDRKRQREEDEEEEAGHGPAFSVNPDSLGSSLPHSALLLY
jgi:hypothetical protein